MGFRLQKIDFSPSDKNWSSIQKLQSNSATKIIIPTSYFVFHWDHPSSSNIIFIQVSSAKIFVIVIYFASAQGLATTLCFSLFQITTFPAKLIHYPLVDLLSSVDLVQSLNVQGINTIFLSTDHSFCGITLCVKKWWTKNYKFNLFLQKNRWPRSLPMPCARLSFSGCILSFNRLRGRIVEQLKI